MKMKRILSSLLVIGMSISLLVGCSSAGKSSSNEVGSQTPTESKSDFPTGPITLIVPYSAGGATDVGCRVLASEVEKILGVPVVIENKPGAAGWIGQTEMLKAKKDGYTLAATNLPALVGGYLDPAQKRTNTYKDFAPIINYTSDFCTISVHPDEKRFTDFKELIEYAKTNEVTVAVGSTNGDDYILMVKINKAFGTKLIPVVSQGGASSLTNLMGGHVDTAILNVSETVAPAENSQIKPLAVGAPERVKEFLPDLPTIKEIMNVEVESASSRGVCAAAGVPADRLEILIDAFTKAANSESFKSKLNAQSLPVIIAAGDDYLNYFEKAESEMKEMAPIFGWTK